MKKILVLYLMMLGYPLFAQHVDYNKIILPDEAKGIELVEKLVQLAWKNYPENEVLQLQTTITHRGVSLARWSWLENIAVSGNLNEFTINPSDENNSLYLPRYNFSARVSLDILNVPTRVKVAKNQLSIAQAEVNKQKLAMRAQIYRLYQEYIVSKKFYEIQLQATEDANTLYILAEEKFKNGEITLEEYAKSNEIYNGEQINLIRAESNLLISKVNIEELIGVSLDTIIEE